MSRLQQIIADIAKKTREITQLRQQQDQLATVRDTQLRTARRNMDSQDLQNGTWERTSDHIIAEYDKAYDPIDEEINVKENEIYTLGIEKREIEHPSPQKNTPNTNYAGGKKSKKSK